MADDAVAQLYQAFVAHDTSRAISVIEAARKAGYAQAQIFDQLFAPAMALLGAAWARAIVDEYAFTQAAVVAEQVLGFVTPPPVAKDTRVTVLMGTIQGDDYEIDRNIIGAALREAGHRVIDLGADVLPSDFLSQAEETGSAIVIVFAQKVGPAHQLRRVREMFAAGGREAVLFVCGAPFSAEPSLARANGANGIIKGVGSALKLVDKAAKQLGIQA